MRLLTSLRRHSAMRHLGRRLEKGTKSWLYRVLTSDTRPPRQGGDDPLDGVKRVLLVRPNFRIGNAVIAARLIQAFAEQRPDIELDYLGTDTTRVLFKGMPVVHYHALGRDMLLRPWQLIRLRRQLRERQYDLAIQMGGHSLTGWFAIHQANARSTLGQPGRLESRYDWVSPAPPQHAHELARSLATRLGLACVPRPWLVVSPQERRSAAMTLAGGPSAALGIFVGGHLNKRLPLTFWCELLAELEARQRPYCLLLGPEEASLRSSLEQACGAHGRILPAMPLRDFVAVLANLARLITPDTGPMHIAAALEVPVVALLNIEGSRKFAPRGCDDLIRFQPEPAEVAASVTSAPRSPGVSPAPCRQATPVPARGKRSIEGVPQTHAYPAGRG